MKKILVVSYTQSGQLVNVVSSIIKPLQSDPNTELTTIDVKPKKPFPFPWPFLDFLEVFPESVLLKPRPIEPIEIESDSSFDLVILAYQVWYLSPSQPITAFLQSEWAIKNLKNKPVITVIGCRNMWIMAQEVVKQYLNMIGANLIDNVVLVDQGKTFETFYTTPKWIMTGKKEFRYLTDAGISENEISSAKRFGLAIKNHLNKDAPLNTSILNGLGAVNVDIGLLQAEKTGKRAFNIWAKIINELESHGSVVRKLGLFTWFSCLLVGIVSLVPALTLLRKVQIIVQKEKFIKLKEYYEQPSGSDRSKIMGNT